MIAAAALPVLPGSFEVFQVRATFFGVPTIRILVFLGVYVGSPPPDPQFGKLPFIAGVAGSLDRRCSDHGQTSPCGCQRCTLVW